MDRVLAETGAPKVILIGHSQGGGILPAYYINNLDGADKVSQLIGLAPSNHGTDADGLIGLQALPILGPLLIGVANAFGPALEQQAVGSEFQQEVYGNGDTRPGVLYTTIASMNDEVVTPYTQQALDGPNVTNIVIQDLYPGLPVGHLGVILSPQVWSVVLDALASNPQANPLASAAERGTGRIAKTPETPLFRGLCVLLASRSVNPAAGSGRRTWRPAPWPGPRRLPCPCLPVPGSRRCTAPSHRSTAGSRCP